jgi:quercetin dioxygenase-like cupin family protein
VPLELERAPAVVGVVIAERDPAVRGPRLGVERLRLEHALHPHAAKSIAILIPVDVRSIEDVAPVVEHNGTVPVWWLVSPREMKDVTEGGHLELVSEFEVAGGGLVDPHSHPTHEFYYVTSGRGIMTIDGEEREIKQGDLVHIPPDLVHSLRPVSDHAPIHCFCFAVGVKDAPAVNYTEH